MRDRKLQRAAAVFCGGLFALCSRQAIAEDDSQVVTASVASETSSVSPTSSMSSSSSARWRHSEFQRTQKINQLKDSVSSALTATSAALIMSQLDEQMTQHLELLSHRLNSSTRLDGGKFHSRVKALYLDTRWIMLARSRVLKKFTQKARDQYLKTSAQLNRARSLEIPAIIYMTWAHYALIFRTGQTFDGVLRELGGLTSFASVLFLTLVLFGCVLWLRARIPGLIKRVRTYEYQFARSVTAVRRCEFVIAFLQHFAAICINIAAVHIFSYLFQYRLPLIEIRIAFSVAFWMVYYQLAQRVIEVLVFRVARRKFQLNLKKRKRIASSILFAGRFIVVGGSLLTVIQVVTGKGALYFLVRNLVGVSVLAAAFIVLNQWRASVIGLYLEKGPDALLADLIEKSKNKPQGFFLACFAFVFVSSRGLLTLLKDTLLSFEQSRKTLAYFFRRRLERHAEENDDELGHGTKLPASLLDAFTLEPLNNESFRIERFDEIETFEQQYHAWKSYKKKGSVLVTAPLGYGKTTWLHRAAEFVDETIEWIEPGSQVSEDKRLLLDLETDEAMAKAVTKLLSGPRKVFIVDDLQDVITRVIGGTRKAERIMELIEHTGHHIFWLCAIDTMTWNYLKSAARRRSWFRRVIELSRWSDEEIEELIFTRAMASGVFHSFEGLLNEQDRQITTERLAEIGQSYSRLIWDSSEGCPWVALHYWVQSLVPVSSTQVKVRLFRRTPLSRLDKWPKEATFLYAAIVIHQRLTVSELSEVLRYPARMCENFLNQGCEEGYLKCDELGRYQLDVNWYRPIVNYLGAQHAIEEL